MKAFNVICITMGVSFLVGCSGGKFAVREPHEHDPRKSEAMNIADAAGISKGMRDVPKEKLDEFRGPYRDSSVPGAVLAGGTVTKLLEPPNTSYGLSSTMFIINFFNVELVPGRDNRVFGWAPESEVVRRNVEHYPTAATSLEFIESFEKALPRGYKLVKKGAIDRAVITPDNAELLTFRITSGGKQKTIQTKRGHDSTTSYILLGGGKLDITFPSTDSAVDVSQTLQILVTTSKIAPEWLYIYLAPGEGFTNIPVILNQGKYFYFEKPEKSPS